MAELIKPINKQASEKKKFTRGAIFTPPEDASVARTWIIANEDVVNGAEQRHKDFVRQVTEVYNKTFKPANRTARSIDSIKNRSKIITKSCTLFALCYARIERAKPSGAYQQDLSLLATAIYNDVKVKSTAEGCGKTFEFKDAWGISKGYGTFIAGVFQEKPVPSSSHESVQISDGGIENLSSSFDLNEKKGIDKKNRERSMGRKKAKEEQRRAYFAENKIKLAAKSVVAEEERNKVLKRHYEIMLFTNAPSGCDDPEALEYFKTMRARPLNDIWKETKKALVDNLTEGNVEAVNQGPDSVESEDENCVGSHSN